MFSVGAMEGATAAASRTAYKGAGEVRSQARRHGVVARSGLVDQLQAAGHLERAQIGVPGVHGPVEETGRRERALAGAGERQLGWQILGERPANMYQASWAFRQNRRRARGAA